MIYLPVQALRALTRFQHLSAGDLVLDRHPCRHRTERTTEASRDHQQSAPPGH